MSKVYDCFMYNGEEELLKIRLNHHNSFVDKFVILESTYTYMGQAKPIYFQEIKNKEWLQPFLGKIIHLIHDLYPYDVGWKYEIEQRNELLQIVQFLYDDDIIIYTDCDEILRNEQVIKSAIGTYKYYDGLIKLDMELHWYYMNCIIDPNSEFQNDYSMEKCFNKRWHMGKICRRKDLIKFKNNLYAIRQQCIETPERLPTIVNAGWHFSNLGEPLNIYNKLNSFSHAEELNSKYKITPALIKKRKNKLMDPLGRNVKFIKTKLDVPQYVLDNLNYYKCEGYILE